MWDAFQQEVLQALGHALYVPRAPAAASPPVADVTGEPLPPALLAALARAAGVESDALPPLPPLARLRTPAGKRALWPQLRRMRGRRP
jgi:hypothetical protein